jgi:hypothetical protein
MKRFVTAPALAILIGAMLLTTSCDSGKGPNISGPSGNVTDQVYTCLGSIALQIAATLVDGEELTFGKLLSSASVCIDAAIAFFNAPSNPTPSSPQVDINTSPTDSAFSGSVQSATVGNCTDNPETLQFNFYVPFAMIVGPRGNQENFNASPSGSTDDELAAQQLFQEYGSYIAGTTTSGPSQSKNYQIRPHTQITFTLPIKQQYKTGEARIVHTDGSIVSLPWLFTDGYQQSGPITFSTSSC